MGVCISANFDNPRIWLSSGVARANELGVPGYGPNALVPRAWREANVREQELLFSHSQEELRAESCIGVYRLPVEFRDRIGHLKLGQASRLEEFVEFVQEQEFQTLQRDLIDFFKPFLKTENQFLPMSPTFNSAGLETVTQEGPSGKLLGLHLDSWDQTPLSDRHQSSNRISINLGKSDRYLLFVNLTMQQILAALPDQKFNEKLNEQSVVASFLGNNMNYPVVKVRIAPGEAYVSPTENIIHDGSSSGQAISDVHLTMRGFFRVDVRTWKS